MSKQMATLHIMRVIFGKLKSAVVAHCRSTVRITKSQLLDLPHSRIKIGPADCVEWDAMLHAWFSLVSKKSPQVRERFQDPYAILAVDPSPTNGTLENRIRHSLAEQFIAGFIKYTAEKKKIKLDEIEAYALIFTALGGLAFKIKQGQAENNSLIQIWNKELEIISRKLPVKFEINGG
jgi:hypothetical protein